MESVERLGRDVDRGHKAERQLSRSKIIIDGLWYPNDRESTYVELFRDSQSTLAAKHDKCLDPEYVEVCQRLIYRKLRKMKLPVDYFHKTAAVSRSEYRTAAGQNAADRLSGELHRVRLAENALKAVLDTDTLHPKFADRGTNHGADHRVESR